MIGTDMSIGRGLSELVVASVATQLARTPEDVENAKEGSKLIRAVADIKAAEAEAAMVQVHAVRVAQAQLCEKAYTRSIKKNGKASKNPFARKYAQLAQQL